MNAGELLDLAGGTLETVDIHKDGVIYVTTEIGGARHLLYSYQVPPKPHLPYTRPERHEDAPRSAVTPTPWHWVRDLLPALVVLGMILGLIALAVGALLLLLA